MNMKLVEPLRELFKDEVRELGRELGLPPDLVNRHPFPGPGLAIRIPGDITREKLDLLRQVDAVYLDEIRKAGLYDEIWQAFAVLLPVRTVGVMGDGRTYDQACALRAVTSTDGMTADYYPFEHAFLGRVASAHHQRGAGDQPGDVRHHVEAAGDDRVGVEDSRRSKCSNVQSQLQLRGIDSLTQSRSLVGYMVTPATSHLDPPKSWEELEEICADLFSREWKDNNATRYGRQGQRQNGVDIYGRPDREKYAAVQCKGRSKWPPDPLTIKDIDAEVTKAKRFTPKLAEYIIATVDPNDKAVQDYARKLTERHSRTGLFSVHVVAWPELNRRLTQHPDLIKKHYSYVANAEIQQDVKDLPDRVAQAILEQLPTLGANEQKSLLASAAIAADPSIAQAMERDLAGRYEAAVQRSLFAENTKLDEFQNLADAASGHQYAAVSANLRRRVLLRASRSASVHGFVERGKALLMLAQTLPGEESNIPARAC